jgi:hypothetical protein
MTSEYVEAYLSEVLLQECDRDYDDENRYLLWISSIHWGYRRSVHNVSHLDWELAQRTMESITAQNLGIVEGGELGSQDSAIDIRGLIGALYLCRFPSSSSAQVHFLNDVCTFERIKKDLDPGHSHRESLGSPPTLTPTLAMIEFRGALRAAHPTCCHELGSEIIDWYSASIVLLGLTDSVDHSTWGCKRCFSCKVKPSITVFQKFPAADQLPPDSTLAGQQLLFNAAVRELVSTFYPSPCEYLFLSMVILDQAEIAANKGLKFEIPAVNMDRQETPLSHVSHHSSKFI